MGQPAAADTVLTDTGLSAVGEVLLVPDLSAVQALPWAEGHSIAPVDMLERDLSEYHSGGCLYVGESVLGCGEETHNTQWDFCSKTG
jgi:hypothetical protein